MNELNDRILQQCTRIYNNTGVPRQPATDSFGTRWSNPDNIAFGQLGTLFFMLELYRQTQDAALWTAIMTRLQHIEQHCGQTKTNNFSLYTGRLGLAKMYLELYYTTRQPQYLSKSVKLYYTYFDDRPDQLKFLDNCSLLDGFAGILLFCIQLYKEAKQDWLMDAIKKSVHILIDKGEMNSKGLYWNGITNANNRQLGWGYGCSGTALVLLELAAFFDSKYFLSLAGMALKYEDEHLPPPAGDSLLHGRAGMDLVRLDAGLLDGSTDIYLSTTLQAPNPHELATYGMVLRQAYRLTGDIQYHNAATNAAMLLLDHLEAGHAITNNGTGLLGALPGIGYFLLTMMDTDRQTVLPGISLKAPVKAVTGKDDAAMMKTFQLLPVNQYLLKKNFTKAFPIVEREFANDVAALLAKDQCPIDGFVGMVKQLNKEKLPPEQQEELHDALEKEYFTVSLKQRLNDTHFPDEKAYLEKVRSIIQLSDDDLLDLELKISDNVWLMSLEEPIHIDRPLDHKLMEDVIFKYGAKSYYMRVNKFNELEVSSVYSMKLVLDMFRQPAEVRNVLNALLHFFTSQSDDIIKTLKDSFEVQSDEELHTELKNTVIDKIRFLLFADVLPLPEHSSV